MSETPPRICVVGSAMIDLIARVPRLPVMGETLVGSAFHQGFGGKGSNQAVMAARLGAAVTMVVKLGRDGFGESTLENYRRNGIDTQHVSFDDQRSSGVAPIAVDDEGHNSIIIVPGANDALGPVDVERAADAIRAARVVVCQCEVPDAANITAFRLARAAGATTILNPAPARPLPPELLALTDILTPNETEAALLTGLPVDTIEQAGQAAAKLRASGSRTVIITLGERGALLLDDQGSAHVPSVAVRAVDSTGAGDAFVGSLAFELASEREVRDALPRAAAIAALSVTASGTQMSFPARAAADAFLAQHGLD